MGRSLHCVVGLVFAVGVALLAPSESRAQSPAPVRIGTLEASAADRTRVAWWNVLRRELRELGYVEGQHVSYEARFGDGRVERLPGLAAELVKLKVAIIVTGGAAATQAAKKATTAIPIVMATGADPVNLGLVSSLDHPGGNVTGVTSITSELSGKRLALLKEIVPKLSRVAIVWPEGNKASALAIRDTEAAGGALDVTVRGIAVRGTTNFEDTFDELARDRSDGVLLVASPTLFAARKRVADLAIRHRLPIMAAGREYADSGALVSYAPSYPEFFRRTAVYVDKILKGAKPGDLPVERPNRFELVINVKTAKVLGLTVPQSVLVRADHVIH